MIVLAVLPISGNLIRLLARLFSDQRLAMLAIMSVRIEASSTVKKRRVIV